MEAIKALREYILDKLEIRAENVKTFVEGGDIFSAASQGGAPRNLSFRCNYQAIIYIENPKEDSRYIFWLIAEWMNAHYPNRPAGSIKFEADILSHDEHIFEFTLDLYEDVSVEIGEDKSVTVTSCFKPGDDEAFDVWVSGGGDAIEPASP